MAKARRVFEVAKELGVASKAIVAKCEAEGVPGITNHMSTVKLGLEATIKEWFSESHDTVTAVETTEHVDVVKARKARRKRAKKVDEPGAGQNNDAAATTAVAEPPVVEESSAVGQAEAQTTAAPAEPEKPAEVAATSGQAEQVEAIAKTDDATPTASVLETDTVAEAAQAQAQAQTQTEDREKTDEPVAEGETNVKPTVSPAVAKPPMSKPVVNKNIMPVGTQNVPDRPTDVKPVGEQLTQPKQAVLRGPKVIRVEKPDEIQAPRPRRGGPGGGQGGRDGGQGGGGVPATDDAPGITRSRGPVRGRGAGAGREGEGGGGQDRQKRRSLTSRRGRSAQALPSGPTKFSDADLAELDAKLNRSTGYVKQRRRDMEKRGHGGQAAPSAVITGGKVEISEPVFIKELSAVTGIKSSDAIKYLFKKGIMATINSAIANETAEEIALEYNIELVIKEQQSVEQQVLEEFENRDPIDLQDRPPVVTVLGHVDHGKTSLLDRVRKADVAAHEDGGITQHVGAYRVTVDGADGKKKSVVFLDTPGHAAFTTMRARGANLTDLVVLVVAADDGVMPQTIESINHAKAAGVPIIVAMNKSDVPQATEENVQKIYGQLAEHGLNPVEWGGDLEVIKTSAMTGAGVTDLLEVLDYQAELLELKADYGGAARGAVIEAEMQPGRGSVARVLVEQGQIKVGDFIVIGRAFGRVRDMTDDRGKAIKQAGPATPLELSGIDLIPDAGDKFYVTDSLQKAERIAETYRESEREKQLANQNKVTLDNFADTLQVGKTNLLRVVLKADVQGSLDVLRKSLEEIGNTEVQVRVLHSAVGGITESDVLLADASDAVVIGFHVIASSAVKDIADERKVDIRLYRVIYDLTNDVKAALEGMLDPERQEEQIGMAEVKEVFKITKLGTVAGCVVMEGQMNKAMKLRVVRDGVVVTDERKFESLRRVKEDVGTVRSGTECGIRAVGFDDVKVGDQIICYNTVNVARTLG